MNRSIRFRQIAVLTFSAFLVCLALWTVRADDATTTGAARTADQPLAARKERPSAPPPRRAAEVAALRESIDKSRRDNNDKPLRELKIVLLASKKDHGPGEHEYEVWQKEWKELLSDLPKVTLETAFTWPDEEQLKTADVIVSYYWNHDWTPEKYRQLDAYLARGGGLVMLHSATIADRAAEHLAERLGLAFQPDKMKYRHGPLDLKIEAAGDEPITAGLPRTIHFYDESYWPHERTDHNLRVLASTVEEDQSWPMIWTFEPAKDAGGKGRVFCSVLGHYYWTFSDPLFRALVLRGMAWSAREPTDRFLTAALKNVPLADESADKSGTTDFRPLFTGHDLAGWTTVGSAKWKVEDGIIVGGQDGDPKKSGLLTTKEEFQDFELALDFMIDEHGKYNSGVYLRQQPGRGGRTGYQVNIGRGQAQEYTAGIFTDRWLDKGDEDDTIRKPGKWNSLRIVVRSGHIVVDLNGVNVADHRDADPAERFIKPGVIALQTYGAEGHAGWVKFRNIKIREIK